jgi:hypothetical protein
MVGLLDADDVRIIAKAAQRILNQITNADRLILYQPKATRIKDYFPDAA